MDACSTAREMWLAIKRLQQGESINKQDVKTKLFWEFGKFTSRDGESVESYYSRFYKIMNELVRSKLKVNTMQVNVQFLQQLQLEWLRFVTIVKKQQDLDTVSYHTLFDILKQYQNEVNEIRAEKIVRNANPLALVAATQHYPYTYSLDIYYQALKPQKTHASSSKQTTSTRSYATTKNKGKEIIVQFVNQRAVTAPRARIPKQVKDYAYHKEKRMLCKQEEKGVPLSAEQDSGPTYDVEPLEKVQKINDHNVFATDRHHSKQPESINDTYVVDTVDSNVTPDSSDMCDNKGTAD
ncbi:hypothetical protein Tco_1412077 [Tanacetum coccineum]